MKKQIKYSYCFVLNAIQNSRPRGLQGESLGNSLEVVLCQVAIPMMASMMDLVPDAPFVGQFC